MDFGKICRESRPISLEEWDGIIESNPALERMPDREGVNPFTKEKVIFPGRGKAYYAVDAQRAGNACLEDGEILTTGIPREVCEGIARRLDARVFEADDS